MKATYSINRPDEMEATIVVTTTVGEWKSLLKQLNGCSVEWPMLDFRNNIRELITSAEKHFTKYEGSEVVS